MYRKTYICLCKRTLNPIDVIFNTVNSILDMNSMHKFKDFEEYLRQLEPAQMDGQTNRMYKHFSILLKSIKNHGTQLKIHFQRFQSIAHNISEIFCLILYMKHAIVHIKKIY